MSVVPGRRRAIAPLLGLAAAIVLFVLSRDLDRFAYGGQLGPGFWPRLALAGLGLACLAKAVGTPATGTEPGADGPPSPVSRRLLVVAVALILGYVLATPVAGFPAATAAFIAAFMWVCGSRSVAALATGAGLGTVGLLYVFVKLVYLPFPKGLGPFEAATLALYRALRIF